MKTITVSCKIFESENVGFCLQMTIAGMNDAESQRAGRILQEVMRENTERIFGRNAIRESS